MRSLVLDTAATRHLPNSLRQCIDACHVSPKPHETIGIHPTPRRTTTPASHSHHSAGCCGDVDVKPGLAVHEICAKESPHPGTLHSTRGKKIDVLRCTSATTRDLAAAAGPVHRQLSRGHRVNELLVHNLGQSVGSGRSVPSSCMRSSVHVLKSDYCIL